MKMIYLASPYSSDKKWLMDSRKRIITTIGALLTHKYKVAIFAPITTSAAFKQCMPHLFGTSFKAWKDVDLCAISHSDEVWVATLKGWNESIGVQAEIKYAKKRKIPVKYINLETLKLGKTP